MADPLAEHHWTIPMALAWIAQPENLDAVGKLSGRRVALWQLSRERQPQHFDDGAIEVVTIAGWDALKEKLEGGAFEAWGVPFDQDKHVSIPPHEWRGLDLFEERNRIVLRINGNPQSGYGDVIFRQHDIRAEWPPENAAPPVEAASRARKQGAPSYASEAVERAMRDLYPPNGIPSPKLTNVGLAIEVNRKITQMGGTADGKNSVSVATVAKKRRDLHSPKISRNKT